MYHNCLQFACKYNSISFNPVVSNRLMWWPILSLHTVPRPGMCPRVDGDVTGTCVEECQHDMDCRGRSKCCSNGCGHVCMSAIPGQLR